MVCISLKYCIAIPDDTQCILCLCNISCPVLCFLSPSHRSNEVSFNLIVSYEALFRFCYSYNNLREVILNHFDTDEVNVLDLNELKFYYADVFSLLQ